MGKSTRAMQGHLENSPALEMGFVFTKEDLTEVRNMLLASNVPVAACAGATAPYEVIVPAQNTTLGSEKTSFFRFWASPLISPGVPLKS